MRIERTLRALLRDMRAATAVEYGLILALIVVAIIASISATGQGTWGMWTNIATKVAAVTPDP